MKVIVGMDSFKGSISSMEANQSVSDAIKSVCPGAQVKSFPMADGGEGTVETLVDGMDGILVNTTVTGPAGPPVQSSYGYVESENLAIIEVAAACGLPLLNSGELDPYAATTYGVGELISHAYEKGARTFIIGLGGSATNDGGVGMLQALGYQFLDEENREIEFGGGALSSISEIRRTPEVDKFEDCIFRIACDVSNVLYGGQGATYVFGPQKGADEAALSLLDAGMKHYADLTSEQMGIDISGVEGGGAAGGLGAAFHGYLGGQLESGIELIMDILKVEEAAEHADLIITGEGRLDAQTSMGKVPAGLAGLAGKYGVPIIAVGGSLTDDAYALNDAGIDAVFSIQSSPVSIEEAMQSELTRFNLEHTAGQIMRVMKLNI